MTTTPDIADQMIAGFSAFRPAMEQAATALTACGQPLYEHAEMAYAQAHHGHRPGSLRTTRLRKKRVQMVMAWWVRQMRNIQERP